jgi:hypothetical protein
MFRLRSVARLARDSGVLPFAFGLKNIEVTLFESLAPRIRYRQRRCLRDLVSAIMSVFSEVPPHHKDPYIEEHQYSHHKTLVL